MSLDVAEEVAEYVCNSCGYRSIHESDVKACCPNIAEKTEYECQICGEAHEKEEEATDCCLSLSAIKVVCPGCCEEWLVEDDAELEEYVKAARKCCNGGTETTAYACTECETTYRNSDDAADCCPNVTEETVYECPVCTFRSKDKGKAMMHCQTPG